jgi:hypothetical protein
MEFEAAVTAIRPTPVISQNTGNYLRYDNQLYVKTSKIQHYGSYLISLRFCSR